MKKKLSNTENYLWNYIDQHRHQISNLSITLNLVKKQMYQQLQL
ncbi:MAG: hypothetical protein ACRCZW_12005 [Lactobacillaceae bacterium]